MLKPNEQARLREYQKLWQEKTRSAQPIDRAQAANAVRAVYAALGLKQPRILFFDSPDAALRSLEYLPIRRACQVKQRWETIVTTVAVFAMLGAFVAPMAINPSLFWVVFFLALFSGALPRWLPSWLAIILLFPVWFPLYCIYSLTYFSRDLQNQFETQVQRSLIAPVKRDFLGFSAVLPATALDQPLHDYIRAGLFQIHGNHALRCIAPELWHHQASVLEFCIDELDCSHNARFWAAFRALVHHCGWVFLRKDVCLVCDRPTKYAFDAQGNYHGFVEPAIAYADGFSVYVHHGTVLPERYGTVLPSQWQARWLVTESNSQLRRLLIQEIGYERICRELDDRALSTWREYELLSIRLAHRESLNLLKMTCPSTGHLHFLVVPPNFRSTREAIRWVNWGIDPDEFTAQT